MKLQAERGEYILLPNGELVPVGANKRHNGMKGDVVTDDAPEGSYIFSDAKHMKMHKKDFQDAIIHTDTPDYIEGKPSKEYKEYNFADAYMSKGSQTPAAVIKSIQRKNPIFNDEAHKYNPYIQAANKENKQGRMGAIQIVRQYSDDIKPKDQESVEAVNPMGANAVPQAQFRNGGLVLVPQYQDWGDVGAGALSGAAAGAGIGAIFGGVGAPIGAAAGAIIGGGGAWLTGRKADKEGDKRKKELAKLNAERQAALNQGRQVSHLTTLGKLAVPDAQYNYLNLDDVKQRTISTSDDILRDYEARKSNIMGNTIAGNNSLNRNASSMGLSPTQSANFIASNRGANVNASTQAGQAMDSQRDQIKLQTSNQLNAYDETLARDKQAGTNIMEQNRHGKFTGAINEFGNNEQNYLTGKDQLSVDKYEMENALDNKNSAYRAQKVGQFNNTVLAAGNLAVDLNSAAGSTDPSATAVGSVVTDSNLIKNIEASGTPGNQQIAGKDVTFVEYKGVKYAYDPITKQIKVIG